MKKQSVGAIVLAAGKGSRMKSKNANKVTLMLADKPIIVHSVELLEKAHMHPIVIVVGFAKDSVMNILGERVYFVEQAKRLGTAHAAQKGLEKVPREITDVLIVNGDDSAFYTPAVIKELLAKHMSSGADLTFLTLEVENPFGLGRIVRDNQGKLLKVVEEKDATEKERFIHEINPGCYVFSVSFLKEFLPKVQKSLVTGEYYLTSLIDLATIHKKRVATLVKKGMKWRGINTAEELEQARAMVMQS